MIPAIELDLVFQGNMKAEDGGPGLEGEQNGALFSDVAGAAWAVDREGGVAALADQLRHFRQGAHPAARAGAAGGAVTEALDALGDGFAVEIHAGHDDDAAVSPVVRRRKNAPVPERENRAMSGIQDVVQVGIPEGIPADGATDEVDNDVADPADNASLQLFGARVCAGLRFTLP